jgi:hypothetical protein
MSSGTVPFLFEITWTWKGPHDGGCGGPDPSYEETVRGDTKKQVKQAFLNCCDPDYLKRGWISDVRVKKIGMAL